MLARILYAAVMLCLLGSLPRAAAYRAMEGKSHPAVPASGPPWAPRNAPARRSAGGGSDGIDRNPPDFAIPRIDR